MKTIGEIVFYKDYFEDFFETLTDKVKDKIDEALFMMTILERVPTKFFKSIEGIKDFLRLGSNMKVIFTEYFAVLIKEI